MMQVRPSAALSGCEVARRPPNRVVALTGASQAAGGRANEE
jgi:hypothetical protein